MTAPRNWNAQCAPVENRKFCWYRGDLRHWCGQPVQSVDGLCAEHRAEVQKAADRLFRLTMELKDLG